MPRGGFRPKSKAGLIRGEIWKGDFKPESIAKKLKKYGVTQCDARGEIQRLKKEGAVFPKYPPKESIRAKVKAAVLAGNLDARRIAREHKISPRQVWSAMSKLRKRGLEIPGSEHGRRFQPESKAALVRAALFVGMPPEVIKERLAAYGITDDDVRTVARRLKSEGVVLPEYPKKESVTAEIRAEFWSGNFDIRSIASKHKIPVRQVWAVISKLRKKGIKIPKSEPGPRHIPTSKASLIRGEIWNGAFSPKHISEKLRAHGVTKSHAGAEMTRLRREGIIFPQKPKAAQKPEPKATMRAKEAHRMVEAAVKAGRGDFLKREVLLRASAKWLGGQYAKYSRQLENFDRQHPAGSWKRDINLINKRNKIVQMKTTFEGLLRKI